MIKTHLSVAQQKLLDEFYALKTRPTPEEYQAFVTRMNAISTTKKPKNIPHTERGFHRNEIKLLPDFNAFVDLPEGWAVTPCYDSGGNHTIESAGIQSLRCAWNSWTNWT